MLFLDRNTLRGAVMLAALGPLLVAHRPLWAGQPAFFEPKEHYYKAKGSSVSVRWVVEPREVLVGRDLTATLVVTGATNPTEVVKPDLRKLPGFDVFKVTDVPDPPPSPTDKEVRFVYKLAPRGTDVKEVPPLKFSYFNPGAPPGKQQFPSTRTDRDEDTPVITVREAPKVERRVVPLEAPERLFQLEAGADALGRGPFVPGVWAWAAAVLAGPLAAVGWFLVWRRFNPTAARLARARRSRAARRSVEQIRKANRTPDPPAAIAGAVLGYLRARFLLPESTVTPSETMSALRQLDVPAGVAERVAEVLRACDRARFAPTGAETALATEAEALLTRLEALA
ncbi:hypothetical protein R5W23_002289 [Gemmata sp. JC673]|uniref:Protein BatD n=1 Tax=Gemmata algarum TaxID=2975278 RepID=A0ABU5F2T9_9BACT|nr:hypothetical protein [Gemmata algarum]MDY3561030.1 hypothetical protein [Gemmata algarum]